MFAKPANTANRPVGNSLLPGGINRLADHIRRIRAGTRNKLLRAAIVDFRRIEIPVLIDAETVHSPEAAGEISPSSPRIEEVPFEVILQHLGSAAVIGPKSPVGSDIK